mgnify:CR=1 FL=1|jgi:hypothetical protein
MTKIYLNNKLVELTSEQETKRLAEVEADKTARDARIAAAEIRKNNRTSGKAKLKTNEALTDAEVEALFG